MFWVLGGERHKIGDDVLMGAPLMETALKRLKCSPHFRNVLSPVSVLVYLSADVWLWVSHCKLIIYD